MDWSAPYVVAALIFLPAVLVWFFVMMVVTGIRHQRAMRGSPATAVQVHELTPEELGMLAGGPQRLVEVALFRLCLEGHVGLYDDSLILVDGQYVEGGDVSPAPDGKPTVRQIILDRVRKALPPVAGLPDGEPGLRRRRRRYFGRRRTVIRPSHLMDMLYYGRKHGDYETVQRRLAELGLLHEADSRNIRLRDRTFVAYQFLLTSALLGLAGVLGVATGLSGVSAENPPLSLLIAVVLAFGAAAVVTSLASKLTGGQLYPTTPAGVALVAKAAWTPTNETGDSLLRFVALRGIRTLPEFERAAHRGEPDADVGPRLKTFMDLAQIFTTIAPFLGGPSGGGSSGGASGASGNGGSRGGTGGSTSGGPT